MRPLSIWQKIGRFHWLLLTLMMGMAVASVFFVFSATHTSDNPELQRAAYQQITWLALGSGVFLFLALTHYENLVRYGWLIYLGMIFLLILVLVFGKEVNGAKSWIRFGSFGIQPAEFCKVAFMCGLAWFMVRQSDHVRKFWFILAVGGLALVPMALILGQPDFGSAAVFLPITFFMLWASGAKRRFLMIPVFCAVAGVFGSYWIIYRADWKGTLQDIPRATQEGVLMAVMLKGQPEETPSVIGSAPAPKPRPAVPQPPPAEGETASKVVLKTYQLNRIRTFFKPDLDPLGAGWTIRQSLIAVGSGGLKGKGYLHGDQNIYGFLPKNIAYNDFIFSVIAEEFGFAGGAILIVCHGLVIICLLRVGGRSRDLAGALFCAGLAGLWFVHFFINIGMTIKVVPITGIPLPLTSYGGTFLVACMAGLGIVQSVWIHRRDF
ncbi:MAG: FtsW/RodA/SpoVE family cell cycle protein [Candidatus Methylacidiphilales bacterium]|nr:FtsW/RodA/SpoVE family cell cycle protein [Candidatus Methylacidiphilales bacterium]